jgi:hypothetical protein
MPGPSFAHGAALAADNDPIDATRVEAADRSDERFDGEETDASIRLLQMSDARNGRRVFDGHPEPNMPWRLSIAIALVDELLHQ